MDQGTMKEDLIEEIQCSARDGLVRLVLTLNFKGRDRAKTLADLRRLVPVKDFYPWDDNPSQGVVCTPQQAIKLVGEHYSGPGIPYIEEILVDNPCAAQVEYCGYDK